jgi:hypothetical protein
MVVSPRPVLSCRKDGGPGRDRTGDLFHAMEVKNLPAIDSKGTYDRRNGLNRVKRRNLLPNCYQKLTSGFGAEPWGIGPFTDTLRR